ncbi:MAG: hypothetical protein ACXABK_02585, partial [Candidatus Heimdallarchaeaceae archaeon]
EKKIAELYPEVKVQLADFFLTAEKIKDDEIVKHIKSSFHSLEDITLKEQTNLGYPFALCKLDTNYNILVPITIDQADIPTYISGNTKFLKLLSIGAKEIPKLNPEELSKWNQSLNKFQLKVIQLLNTEVKNNLHKEQPKDITLVDIDHLIIYDFIKEHEKRIKDVQSYNKEILKHFELLKMKINNEESIWDNEGEFQNAINNLKQHLREIEKKQITHSKESQIQFLKLKKEQRQINGKTKRYKIEEKRGKKITREEKELLVKTLREFQSKKRELQKNIDLAKKLEESLEKWLEIISVEDRQKAEEMLLTKIKPKLKKKINEFLETQDVEEIIEKIVEYSAKLENITVHIIFMPAVIYSFNAKQSGKDFEGKLLYLPPMKEYAFLKPAKI